MMMKLWRNSKKLCLQKRLMNTEGYKSIGSFHSEDVDVLMTQTDDVYVIPELPFTAKCLQSNDKFDGIGCSSDFLLDRKKWSFLNHGAFGAALRVGYDRAEQWRFVYFSHNHPRFITFTRSRCV
jgi:hypothetical protein